MCSIGYGTCSRALVKAGLQTILQVTLVVILMKLNGVRDEKKKCEQQKMMTAARYILKHPATLIIS